MRGLRTTWLCWHGCVKPKRFRDWERIGPKRMFKLPGTEFRARCSRCGGFSYTWSHIFRDRPTRDVESKVGAP